MNNISKSKINKYLLVFIICLCLFSFFYYIRLYLINLNSKNYINDYLKKYYKDYDIEYVDTKECRSSGGVWFPHRIYYCNMSTYTIKNNYEQFELIITDNRNHKYYTRGLFVYSLKDELCKEYVSCTDGNICGETADFICESPFNKGCVTVIKKY